MINFQAIDFSNPDYLKALDGCIVEKKGRSLQTILMKSQVLLNKIFSEKSIIIDVDPSTEIYKKILLVIKKISLLRPGRKLLKSLHGYKTQIYSGTENFEKKIHMKIIDKLPVIFFNTESTIFYVSATDRLEIDPAVSVLAHELIHASHVHKSLEQTYNRLETEFSDFNNEEEFFTISGLLKDFNQNYNTIDLCENVFLRALKLPLRKNHNGAVYDSEIPMDKIGIAYMIKASAFKSIKDYLVKYPKSVNLPVQNPQNRNQKCLPLSFIRDLDSMILLLNKGARTDLIDDLGGPIMAACSYCYSLASNLILESLSRGHKINLANLLDNLIRGYEDGKFSAKEEEKKNNFLQFMFFIESCQFKFGKNKPKVPLIHRALHDFKSCLTLSVDDLWFKNQEKISFSIHLIRWCIKKNRYDLLNIQDSEGDTFLMALVPYFKILKEQEENGSKEPWYSRGYALTVLCFRALLSKEVDLSHKNLKGETFDTLFNDFMKNPFKKYL